MHIFFRLFRHFWPKLFLFSLKIRLHQFLVTTKSYFYTKKSETLMRRSSAIFRTDERIFWCYGIIWKLCTLYECDLSLTHKHIPHKNCFSPRDFRPNGVFWSFVAFVFNLTYDYLESSPVTWCGASLHLQYQNPTIRGLFSILSSCSILLSCVARKTMG